MNINKPPPLKKYKRLHIRNMAITVSMKLYLMPYGKSLSITSRTTRSMGLVFRY